MMLCSDRRSNISGFFGGFFAGQETTFPNKSLDSGYPHFYFFKVILETNMETKSSLRNKVDTRDYFATCQFFFTVLIF